MIDWIARYVDQQKAALDSIPAESVETWVACVREAWAQEKQLFVFGNGGSAANASHFATDLGKGSSDAVGKRFKVLSTKLLNVFTIASRVVTSRSVRDTQSVVTSHRILRSVCTAFAERIFNRMWIKSRNNGTGTHQTL